jgi:hypothetical protein
VPPFDKHIFICCNRREPGHVRGCCDPTGSEALQKAFKKALAERGINARARQQVRLPRSMREGPDRRRLSRQRLVRPRHRGDVDEIVEEHIIGGRPSSGLLMP